MKRSSRKEQIHCIIQFNQIRTSFVRELQNEVKMRDKNLTAVQSQILLSPKRQQSGQYVNVGRGDLVCAVKNQGIPVHHHRPDQGAIRQGKDHCKKLLIVWHPKNTTLYYIPGIPIYLQV